ncbi:PKD domain-containing protein [Candidatus Gottesmanbacteria bacterium]|nr:PKD domain-containing protein [Candidatus Gottesmanbacteria bacterium]
MKRILLLFFLFSFFILGSVRAHGRISILQVNGEAARANTIADDVANANIKVPLDIAPKAYVVNEAIVFSVDTTFLPPGTNSSFQWDFGDGGTSTKGVSATHTYIKTGTYTVTITETPATGQPTMTLSISIKPSAYYTAPVAKIIANGKTIEDPLLDYVEIRPGKTVSFDAGKSTGSIKTYVWDFGDKATGDGKTVSHTYNRDTFFPAYALLRVTDENGLTGDTDVIIDTPLAHPSPLADFFEAIRQFFANLFAKK